MSVIYEYGRDRVAPMDWDRSKLAVFEELLTQAAIYDSISGQPDCVDPAKSSWLEEVRNRVNSRL